MSGRETWASRAGFILAATGSAVGLGNVWRFPYITAEGGGAAFLAVYLIAVLLIGVPAMLVEFVIGRGGKQNVVDVYEKVGHRRWRFIGVLGLFTGFWILSYYSVIGGWVLRYLLGSVTGSYLSDPASYFGAISAGPEALLFHLLFMTLTVGIVAFGIEHGIELATKVMVPAIIVLMITLALWAVTLAGSGAGYAFYLSPDTDVIVANFWDILPQAIGQALFSLSLGMGVMVTYSSYIARDESLWGDSVSVVALNTFIGVVAGFIVFPVLFAQNVDPGSAGAGAIFVSMATAFGELPAGRLLGVVFFAIVGIAALSSAISLLEVVTAYFVENTDYSRPAVTTVSGTIIFLLGIPSALDTDVLGQFDQIAANLLLPLGVVLAVLFVGWVYADSAIAELAKGTNGQLRTLDQGWLWHVRTLLLVIVLGTLLLKIGQLAGVA
jgi:NSS family neurotransmitter:Na+ symporter